MGRWTLATNEKRTQHPTHTGWNFQPFTVWFLNLLGRGWHWGQHLVLCSTLRKKLVMGDQVKLLACRPMRRGVLCSTQMLFSKPCIAAGCMAAGCIAAGTLQFLCFCSVIASALQHCCAPRQVEVCVLEEEVWVCLTFPAWSLNWDPNFAKSGCCSDKVTFIEIVH